MEDTRESTDVPVLNKTVFLSSVTSSFFGRSNFIFEHLYSSCNIVLPNKSVGKLKWRKINEAF